PRVTVVDDVHEVAETPSILVEGRVDLDRHPPHQTGHAAPGAHRPRSGASNRATISSGDRLARSRIWSAVIASIMEPSLARRYARIWCAISRNDAWLSVAPRT